jgi:hypothetical protein
MRPLALILCLITVSVHAQPAAADVSQQGITPFTTAMPAMLPERFIDITKAWANAYTGSQGYDAYNISNSSITISSVKRNAFRYQNAGETIENKISYNLIINFNSSSYTLQFVVDEIYGENGEALKYKLPDFYKSDGTLKDGYEGLDKTLETTVNDIVQSHYSYILNYK